MPSCFVSLSVSKLSSDRLNPHFGSLLTVLSDTDFVFRPQLINDHTAPALLVRFGRLRWSPHTTFTTFPLCSYTLIRLDFCSSTLSPCITVSRFRSSQVFSPKCCKSAPADCYSKSSGVSLTHRCSWFLCLAGFPGTGFLRTLLPAISVHFRLSLGAGPNDEGLTAQKAFS